MRALPLILIILLILGCAKKSGSDAVTIKDGLIEINVTRAFEDQRDFAMSDLVEDVELLYLESTPESYFDQARVLQFGKKYIMLTSYRLNKIYLFERKGKFIRTIGQEGQGPEEYNRGVYAVMDPAEKNIIVMDYFSKKIIRYGTDGKYIKHRDYSEEFPEWPYQEAPFFIDDDHFAFARSRPRTQIDDYHTLYVYDLDLNLVKRILPRPNNDSLCLNSLSYISQDVGFEGPYYWESFSDTMYYLNDDMEAKPAYSFVITDHKYPLEVMKGGSRGSSDEENYYKLGGVTDLPGYLMAWGILETSCWLVYDKKERDAFVVAEPVECQKPINTWITHWIRNDVYGLQTSIQNYHREENIMVDVVYPEWVPELSDVDCIRELDVTHPEIRDELCDFVENWSGEELPVLVIMHLKGR